MTDHFLALAMAALYARVPSDRQDVGLPAGKLQAHRDYAERYGCSVAREFTDKAENGRIADRLQFGRKPDMVRETDAPLRESLECEAAAGADYLVTGEEHHLLPLLESRSHRERARCPIVPGISPSACNRIGPIFPTFAQALLRSSGQAEHSTWDPQE